MTNDENRSFTAEDRLTAFRRATSCLLARYPEQVAKGMTDAALAEALERVLGIEGGSCGPDMPYESHKGAGLQIWAGWTYQNPFKHKPLWSGRATVAMAREVYHIPNPDDHQLALF